MQTIGSVVPASVFDVALRVERGPVRVNRLIAELMVSDLLAAALAVGRAAHECAAGGRAMAACGRTGADFRCPTSPRLYSHYRLRLRVEIFSSARSRVARRVLTAAKFLLGRHAELGASQRSCSPQPIERSTNVDKSLRFWLN